jgi:hypothetical protein
MIQRFVIAVSFDVQGQGKMEAAPLARGRFTMSATPASQFRRIDPMDWWTACVDDASACRNLSSRRAAKRGTFMKGTGEYRCRDSGLRGSDLAALWGCPQRAHPPLS